MKITYALLIAILITILIVPTINLVARASVKEAKLVGGDSCSRCSCSCSQYPIMYPDPETLQAWLQCYNRAPHACIDPELEPPTGSVSLLSHLEYDPVERDQGSCGNCWAWAGTGVLEIALDVQEGVLDRLSMQYLNSKYNGGTGSDWACCGGWLEYLADFYASEGFTIPWSNTNASWADGAQTCDDGTTVPWQTISTSPNYSITTCTAESITTHGVGQTEAINNIKNVLAQDKAIWFGYFLPTGDDWDQFFSFWNYQSEDVIWNPDYSCGHVWDSGGGGHAVLCVGYNDDDPENAYWIMVNSWGTAYGGRPNGIFHLDMDMDYDCYFYDPYPVGWYSFYWQTLDVAFDVVTSPTIINHTPSGTDVPVTTTITVTFSEAMNHTSAENAFSVSPSVSGSFSWSGNTMTFTPSSLAYGTTYEVTIGTGAMDSAGNPLGSPYSWEFTTTADTIKRFDFGTGSSPVETGYTRITTSTLYSVSSDYGWDSSTGLGSRDRGSPDNLRRDLVFSSVDRTFKVDVTNGAYLVMVIVGDQSYMHDNIRIYAEDALKSTVSTGVGEFVQKVFVVSVADGTLDLMFQDEGGSDSNWVINAILIKPYSESKFDFGTEGSPVESGYTQVLSSTSYSESAGYGWADTVDLDSRDRGAPDSLRRDFVFSSSNRTFNIDLPNGKYMVVIIIGDNSYSHDRIDVYCEGTLVVNDLCVEKGYLAEVAFLAEVSDNQLEIMFCDDGGANAHWVVNSIHVKTTFDLRLKFDFGTSSSPVEDGYVRVTPTTAYLPSTSYGWSDITDLWSRDRGAPDALRRDLVFSSSDRTFNVDIPNGQYQVTLIVGDQNYMHDKIDIYAEGVMVVDDLNVSAGTFTEITFTVTVSDGQLNATFHDDGGADANWVINALTIDSFYNS